MLSLRQALLAGGCWLALAVAVAPRAGAAERSDRLEPDFAALARLPSVQLAAAPVYPQGAAESWALDEIMAQLGRCTDRMPAINSNRTTFLRPDHQWVVAFKDWFMRVQKSLKLEYRNEVWDCDDFARCFVAFANLAALSSGERRGTICMGWATVTQRRAFGGMRGSGGGHAVVLVGTASGLFVIEPQTGAMAPLRDYPNRGEFEEINL